MAAKRKFNVGDRVKINCGYNKGDTGVVVKVESEFDVWLGHNVVHYYVNKINGSIQDQRYPYTYLARELDHHDMVVYGAGSWFTPKAKQCLDDMYEVIRESGLNIWSPKDECLCPPDADFNTRKKVFDADVKAIDNCDLVIASTCDKDMGTLFESGYAFAKEIPVIYYAELPKGSAFNLMLATSAIAVATSKDELYNILSYYKDNDWNFKLKLPYSGPIE